MAAFVVSEEVSAALERGAPVVALESTIISHGLPRPRNLEAAREFETILRDQGVTPATIAVLDGIPRIGLDDEGVRRIADEDLAKASVRDLPIIQARGGSAATTVAATSHLAALAGIRVFATGGLGGVHRGATDTFDESADLTDPREHADHRGERRGEVGARHRRDPRAARDPERPGRRLPHRRLPELLAARESVRARLVGGCRRRGRRDHAGAGRLGNRQGIVVANPVPADQPWDAEEHDRVLAQALAEADAAHITGKAVTPFLLLRIVELVRGPQPRGQPRSRAQQRARRRRDRHGVGRAGMSAPGGRHPGRRRRHRRHRRDPLRSDSPRHRHDERDPPRRRRFGREHGRVAGRTRRRRHASSVR